MSATLIDLDARLGRPLRAVMQRLEGVEPWAVTGSLCHRLHGLPLEVRDIDLQTDGRGAYEIERRFASESILPVRRRETHRIRSHFGKLALDGLEVEIMGDLQTRRADGVWDEPIAVEGHRTLVRWSGLDIPVMTLEHECLAYERFGRPERAAMLWRFREQQRTSR